MTLRRIEKQLARRIHRFDLQSLLRLLAHLGWRTDEIRFTSHFSTSSQASLVHAIEFVTEPTRKVTITLNMGLLAPQNPLPSYFIRRLEASDVDAASFVDFVGCFDHAVLRDYIRNIFPETNRNLFTDWQQTKRRYLYFLNLKSCNTLHWLFSTVFPELGVAVDKASVLRDVKTIPIRLGETALGSDAVFGRKSAAPVGGRRVTLFTDSELTEGGRPWVVEIKQRLDETVFPIIGEVGIDLEIFLVVRSQQTWAKLTQESYLGYDQVRGGTEQARRIKLFSGHVVV